MAKDNKVSYKTPEILEGSKKICEHLSEMRKLVDAMPECTISKSLATSQEAYEKKINSIVKKEAIQKAMAAIRKNPEKFISALPDDMKANFASSDSNVAEIIDADAVGAHVPKSQKQKGRK